MKVVKFLLLLLFIGFLFSGRAEIYLWEFFEDEFGLSPLWTINTADGGMVKLDKEDTLFLHSPYSWGFQALHGRTSLNIIDTNASSFALIKREFPQFSENEYLVEFYFLVNKRDLPICSLTLYKPRRGDGLADINVGIQERFDSSGQRYWRLRIQSASGYHYFVIAETLMQWCKFQIHKQRDGYIALWIKGESLPYSFTSLSDTLKPDTFLFGFSDDSATGDGYWDDFIITTPPKGIHPRVYFPSDSVAILRTKRSDADP